MKYNFKERNMKRPYYITTPIYYPSSNLHIGHCYCSVAADSIARFKKLQGYDVYFLTGTDEHGQKIERKAEEAGTTPKEYVDKIVAATKDLWKLMDVNYDGFIRTTDDYHVKAVQKIFKELYDRGDIYKGEYKGWYCTPCESFFTETQLKDGKCPDCGREVELTSEECYFFRLSKYQDRLTEYIETHPEFIQPAFRAKEMINNFLKPGLEDLCVSRTSIKWGIPVDFDPDHVVYVWLDALTNYITKLGYTTENHELFDKFWPADLHLVGKEIIRFHTIIWPAMLMALDLPLPKQVFGHGWLVFDGEKMSKSRGNVVDPVVLCDRYGVDAIRYFLMREMPLGSDGNFSNEALFNRINSDLANDLGNLISRTAAMIEKYFGGILPENCEAGEFDKDLKAVALNAVKEYENKMESLQISVALTEVWKLVSRCNKYIDETTPWVLAKDESKKNRLGTVLYNLAECLRIISVLISPVMTKTPLAIKDCFAFTDDILSLESTKTFGLAESGVKITKPPVLFPRIDVEAELKANESKKEEKKEEKNEEPKAEQIAIDDFAKVQLLTAKVLTCEKLENSDKLLKMTLDDGTRTRTVVSGIAKHYSPEEMLNKTVVLVANLKPAKLRGVLSEGMILCAEDENGNLSLVSPEKPFGAGLEVR